MVTAFAMSGVKLAMLSMAVVCFCPHIKPLSRRNAVYFPSDAFIPDGASLQKTHYRRITGCAVINSDSVTGRRDRGLTWWSVGCFLGGIGNAHSIPSSGFCQVQSLVRQFNQTFLRLIETGDQGGASDRNRHNPFR